MATAFKDMKPFPKAGPALGGKGHNNPPIEESVLLDLDERLRSHDGLIERIDTMVAKADQAGPCTNADTAGRYGDFIKMTSAAVRLIEQERETLNRPLLNAQRGLKARADSYSAKASGAGQKVRRLLDAFLAEQERLRREEAARIAEQERQAETTRQAQIDEANRIAATEAEAERVRLQAIEDEKAAAEARESVVVEVAPEPVFVPEPHPAFVSVAPEKAPIRGDYGTAVSTVETWHVEVTNIRQVPDTFLKHPAVIEALQKVIAPSVRGKSGLREIKGCRIYSTVGSSVR